MRRCSTYLRHTLAAGAVVALAPWLFNCSGVTTNSSTTGGTTSGVVNNTTGGTTSGTTSGTTTSGTTTGSPTTGTVSKSASVSGTVNSNVQQSSGSQKFGRRAIRELTDSACAQATFSIYSVGGDGNALGQATAAADGNFTISWNVNVDPNAPVPEIILHFDCATAMSTVLRCFGKPNDTGLVCDPISNALATALESSLGTSLETDPHLNGLSVAKIVEGLAETLKLVSQLNPSQDVIAELAAATDPNAAAAIIAASPVGSMFSSIATIAQQTIAQNTVSQDANAQTTALASVWTPGKVIELMASLGLNVQIALDDNSDAGPGLYSQVSQVIDNATGTTFNADVAKYLSNLYDTLYVANASSQVSMLCVAQSQDYTSYHAPITYPPDVAQDSNGVHQLTCTGDTAVRLGVSSGNSGSGGAPSGGNSGAPSGSSSGAPSGGGAPSGTTGAPSGGTTGAPSGGNSGAPSGGGAPSGTTGAPSGSGSTPTGGDVSYSIWFSVGSAFVEPDRNDPTGTHSDQNGPGISLDVSLVDIFPEFDAALSDPNSPCSHFTQDSGPNPDYEGFGQCLRQNGYANYFAGVLGVYRFLTNTSLSGIQMSLNDIYDAFVTDGGVRLAAQLPYNNFGAGFYVTDTNNTWQNDIPLLLQDANTSSNGQEVYQTDCPDWLCANGQLPQDQITAEDAQIDQLLHDTRPGFGSVFGVFENIPTFAQLQQQILQSAHHVEYNPSGASSWPVQGVDPDAQGTIQATSPILCAFLDGNNVVRRQFGGDTHVSCLIAQGTWTNGRQTDGPDYTGYFGLAARESEDTAHYFGLVDPYTGQDYTFNGQSFRIRDMSVDDTTGISTDGSTVYNTDVVYCYNVQTNGGVQSTCSFNVFNYVALSFPNLNQPGSNLSAAESFYAATVYQPYSTQWPVSFMDANGVTQQGQIPVAFTTADSDPSDTDLSQGFPVCVNSYGVQVDSNMPNVVTNVGLDGNTVVPCYDANPPFYFLSLAYIPNGPTEPNQYNYFLVRNDGQPMNQANCTPTPQSPCQETVNLLDVQTALNGDFLGPQQAQAFMANFNLANLAYDAKFDAYCADPNSSGTCDCYNLADPNNPVHLSGSACTLDDAVGDQKTLASTPVFDVTTANIFWSIDQQAGNQSGETLANTLQTLQGQDSSLDLSQINFNWNQVFVCANGNSLQGLAFDALADPQNANNAGQGCGESNTPGPVQMLRLVPRNNAYDIARPQTLLKLISSATQSTGTGVQLTADTPSFNFSQALALEFVRLVMPLNNIHVRVNDWANGQGDQLVDAPPGTQVVPTQVFGPAPGEDNSQVSLTGAVLRAFLVKGGIIPAQQN